MRLKQRLLKCARLYVIVDADACRRRPPLLVARQAVAGGADIVQWRAKSWDMRRRWQVASQMAKALRATSALFIVNDHVDLALAVGADGVHLGQDDFPLEVARSLAGKRLIVGVSTHSAPQAFSAQLRGADYIGVGPIFSTPTKPSLQPVGTRLLRLLDRGRRVTIPWFAIGGIDRGNLPLVLSSGAGRVAVVRAVAGAADAAKAARRLRALLP